MSVKLYFLSLMQDKRGSLIDRSIKAVLFILSVVYGFAQALIDMAYKTGLRKIHRADLPVISVGNITLGGTGKTPFAIFLADHYALDQKKVSILIRGYGKDESVQLTDELAEVKVYVGQDRVRNASLSFQEGNDLAILDDGFQHRRLARDLDIVLIDAQNPFGNGHMFPRGVLREPVGALERAGIIVATKIDKITDEQACRLEERIRTISPKAVFATARHRPLFFTDVTGAAYSAEDMRGKKVVTASGIGDPAYFRMVLENSGPVIADEIIYADHHMFSRADVARMYASAVREQADHVIVTKKDHVKLKGLDISSIEDRLMVLNIAIEIVKGKESLIAGLNSVLSG